MSKKRPLRKPLPKEKAFDEFPFREALWSGSDLSTALIGGASIENALMTLLESFLVECPESTALFDINGPLDSMSKCNKLALCLGLISRKTFENVRTVAKIRNLFAHSHVTIDFRNKDVVELCKKELSLDTGDQHLEPINDALERFRLIVNIEWVRLMGRNPMIKRQEEWKWFVKKPKP